MSDFEDFNIYEDDRYTPATNAVLRDLVRYLIDAGHRLSVSQHSQIIRRVEKAVDAEVKELVALVGRVRDIADDNSPPYERVLRIQEEIVRTDRRTASPQDNQGESET